MVNKKFLKRQKKFYECLWCEQFKYYECLWCEQFKYLGNLCLTTFNSQREGKFEWIQQKYAAFCSFVVEINPCQFFGLGDQLD